MNNNNNVIISDENKEKIEKTTEIINKISNSLNEKVDENSEAEKNYINGLKDFNKDGKIDKTDEIEYQKINHKNHKDIFKLFYFIYGFTFICLIFKFVSFFFFKITVNIELKKLADTLNAAIVFIGSAEGIKSFTLSVGKEIGESAAVPAYKLKYLFSYLTAFTVITIFAVVGEFILKYTTDQALLESIPDLNANDFLNGLLSNTIAYLIARYGNKIAEDIDLSSLSFFKKKQNNN